MKGNRLGAVLGGRGREEERWKGEGERTVNGGKGEVLRRKRRRKGKKRE